MYLLRCADNSLYCGETPDLAMRERNHNEGRGGSYTSKRRPVRMIYAEQFASRSDALKREQQIKGWTREKKEALIARDLNRLKKVLSLEKCQYWFDDPTAPPFDSPLARSWQATGISRMVVLSE